MGNSDKTENNFLGNRFETCLSCGELIGENSSACRFCGYQPGGSSSENPIPAQVPTSPSHANPASGKNLSTDPCYFPDGRLIPPEYCGTFREYSFSWPAFWFADLWHADKGNIPKAIRHFITRSITNGFGIASIVLMARSGMSEESSDMAIFTALGPALIFALVWFLGVIANAALSWMDALTAHREYCSRLNTKPQETERARKTGIALYWAMLYVPFTVFLVGFIIMLFSITVNAPDEPTATVEKIQKVHESIMALFF